IPRERYNTELRERIEGILLASFKAESADFTTYLSDAPMARVHFILRAPAAKDSEMNLAATEARLVEASRMWTDDLHDALVARAGEAAGHDLYQRYKSAFPTGYRDAFSAEIAASDVGHVEEALSAAAIAINLHRRADSPEGALNFKLCHAAEPVALSAILPILEQMGFGVVTEMTFRIVPKGARAVYVHDVLLRAPDAGIDVSAIRENVEQAFLKVWSGELENDGLNRLIIGAGLDWREVVVLRAYTRYLRQARITFSQHYIENTLARAAPIVRLLVDLFVARLDPARGGDREAEAERILGEIEEALEAVSNLEEDRILRRFLNLIKSTLRTNYFQTAPDGRPKPYLSVKLDSTRIKDLPLPRPTFEIFVYSPRVEGIHLRGGKVARGGIRWSDRREDFRTEVLGLMKAQMVKNAVIVPVGSKGGFVVKQPPAGADRARLQEEVVECYKTLIRGMLDLTDNLVGGRVAPPPRVVRRDGDDPYLVVAADKGTATFSDIANGVAREYEFWLDDAFASGGSAGYDHKGMAITARGAWVSVERHFRELGVDLRASDITVVGVGDMAGDVFGNGVLQSERIKLLGAFNHQHVFVDPDPDPARSFAERRRLFALPRSTWADYDPAVLSPGGGVFERSAKSITLGAEARTLFGIDRERLTPSELIRAMLRAPVELVWLGGIGTFIKAAGESHADVGDRANDAVRIDGKELRCRVVGEGANLGVTQRGRIEYALRGGHINTDAIDNSGGVDCSDHEVNIKILLRGAVESGALSMPARDALLKEMTEAVAALVLRDNYQQTQAITVILAQSRELLAQQARMMRGFERAGRLDRAIEYLPNDEDLATRRVAGYGLTRPEIAILLAYAKIVLSDELLSS
ncbi:MAG: NAD-glutamate dehydrogenase domain-containing protein, partial [Alphaproteobacteria bacterium]